MNTPLVRSFVTIAIGVVLFSAVQGVVSRAAVPDSSLLRGATGRVTRLDLTHITVDRLTCQLSGKSAALAGDFAVGENVSIGCARGVLRTIALAPVLTGSGRALPPIHILTTFPAHSAPTTKASTSWSGGIIALGGTTPASTPTSVDQTGPITSLDPTQISVNGVSCPFYAADLGTTSQSLAQRLAAAPFGVYQSLTNANVSLGDTATITCTYTDSSSKGQITVAK
jgi:hypothetical protein